MYWTVNVAIHCDSKHFIATSACRSQIFSVLRDSSPNLPYRPQQTAGAGVLCSIGCHGCSCEGLETRSALLGCLCSSCQGTAGALSVLGLRLGLPFAFTRLLSFQRGWFSYVSLEHPPHLPVQQKHSLKLRLGFRVSLNRKGQPEIASWAGASSQLKSIGGACPV